MSALSIAALCAGLISSAVVIWDRLGKWRSDRKAKAAMKTAAEFTKDAFAEQRRAWDGLLPCR